MSPAVTFTTQTDGQVEARLDEGWPLFNEALSDSITSLPPRGSKDTTPSTYWIDVADSGARRAAANGDGTPFTSGNVTRLWVEGAEVFTSLDFEEEISESMALDDFLAVLSSYREQVLAVKALRETEGG